MVHSHSYYWEHLRLNFHCEGVPGTSRRNFLGIKELHAIKLTLTFNVFFFIPQLPVTTLQ